MSKRFIYNNHFKFFMNYGTDSRNVYVYHTDSAIWLYNKTRDVVVLFSDRLTNDTIVYDKYSKNYAKHKERIIRLCQAA
jgi:hypothetical protein